MMGVALAALTAEEYCALSTPSCPTELVRGEIIERDFPGCRHGAICGHVAIVLGEHLRQHSVGHCVTNNAGVLTERARDTVRGPDVPFISYERLPKGPLPNGYPDKPPEVVFEVRSPSDRWSELHEKVSEYLKASVLVVCVIDAETQSAHLFRDLSAEVVARDGELRLPEIHADCDFSLAEILA